MKRESGLVALVAIYTDDLQAISSIMENLVDNKRRQETHFKMKDLGESKLI